MRQSPPAAAPGYARRRWVRLTRKSPWRRCASIPAGCKDAVEALQGTDIPVASVATGFPAGQTPLAQRIAEIEQAIEAGAARDRHRHHTAPHVLTGNWRALYDEIRQFRQACGDAAHMKTILATGDLGTLKQVYQASLVAMMAGSDFIKTSTGKESVNATLEFGLVMARAIRDYQRAHRLQGRLQARRRDQHSQAGHGLAVPDERRAGR